MSEWKEAFRAMVFPWQCDHYGHMNARFYFDHFDDSSFQVYSVLDCPRSLLVEAGVQTVTGRNTVSFIEELTAGTQLVTTVAVTRVGNRSVTFTHRMHNAETGQLCATNVGTEVFFNPVTRKSADMPDSMRERLTALLVETNEEAPRPAASTDAGDADDPPRGHWHDTHRGLVVPWRCDHFGHLNARWYAHHFDDAGFHLFSMAGVDFPRLLEQNIALVTVQSSLTYVRETLPGTLFVIRSGFSHVGTKSAAHLHRFYNVETNEVHATMESTDVAFDLEARKAVPLLDAARETLLANRVDPS